jgi:CHRD domain
MSSSSSSLSKEKILAVSALVAALGLAMIISMAGLNNNNNLNAIPSVAFAQQQQKFTAKMTGSEEVPPKNTKATGTAEFNLSPDGKTLSFKVSVNNINSVTMAHIHSGKKGVNGPVVVTLFYSAPPTGPINGVLSQASATAANLEGPLKGKQISDLVNLIKNGQAYANVHTTQNPKGEIRGQIS